MQGDTIMAKTCPHLEPLERELEKNGIPLGEGMVSPYGPQWGTWFWCNVLFYEPALRVKLALANFITYDEYDGRVAGSDATFYCPRCKRAIVGIHPHYATPDTPRLP